MKTILKNTGILLAITLIATVALSFVYELTKEPIAAAQLQKKTEAYQKVYEAADAFDTVPDAAALLERFNAAREDGSSVEEVLAAKDAAGQTLGYVLTAVSTKGYAVLEHSESPGFGANCENADVRQQFIGITAADQLDGISGATYTTNALKAETQAAIDLVRELGGAAA